MAEEAAKGAVERIKTPGTDVAGLFAGELSVILTDAAAVERVALELAQAVMATLAVMGQGDGRTVGEVQAFVDRAVHREAFMKQLTAAIVKADKALSKARPVHCLVLIGWISSLLCVVPLPGAVKAAEALVKIQVKLLAQCACDPSYIAAALDSCSRAPGRRRADLLEVYASLAPADHPAVGAVLHAVASLGDDMEEGDGGGEPGGASPTQLEAKALEAYVNGVLGAKARPQQGAANVYSSVLRSAPPDVLENKVMPTAARMTKRAPEAIMGALAHLMENISDPALAAKLISEVKDAVLTAARHSDPVRQSDASAMLCAYASRAPSEADLQLLVDPLGDALAKKQAKTPVEKEGAVRALQGVAAAASARGERLETCAASVVDKLAAAAKDEPNEGVKALLVSSIASWSVLLGSDLPQSYVDLLRQLDQSVTKETIRQAQCVAASDIAWSRPDLATRMSQASSALSKVVLEGLAKPPVRYDAIPALLALILVSRSDAEAASALTASLFWAPALTAGSRIVDPAVLPRLSAGQLRACARLCRMLLEPAPRPALPDVEWVVPVACEMLAGCLLRAEEGDAQPAECCQQVVHDGIHTETLFAAVMRLVGDEAALKDLLGSGDDSHARTAAIRRALSNVLPESSCSLTPKALGMLMVACMHPNATGGPSSTPDDGPWLTVCERGGGLDPTIASHAHHGLFAEIRLHLSSGATEFQTAAARAVGAAVQSAPEATWVPARDTVAMLLDRKDHDALTNLDRVIFFTPEDALATETDDGRALVLAEDVALTMEPEDEEAAAAVKQPLKKGEKPNPQVEARLRQLAREAGSRKRTLKIKARLDLGMDTIAEMCRAAPSVVQSFLAELSDMAFPLLKSQLIGDASALATARLLCNCLPPPLNASAAPMADVLRKALVLPAAKYVEDDAVKAMVREVHAATAAVTRPLPPAAYAVVFPIIEGVLTSGMRTKIHEPAIAVVALHASPGMPLPRARLFRSLFMHLEGTATAKFQVTPLLQRLGEGVETASEIAAVVEGTLANGPHVRVAALMALARVPAIREGALAEESFLVAALHTACFDTVAANATMAKALFKQSRVSLGSVPHRELLADLLGPSMLSSPYRDTRLAAGSSLAAAVEELGGDCLEIALESLILSYVPGSTDAVRSGVGIGLAKCAVLMNATQVTAAVQFLLGRGLADPASGVRSDMVTAAQEIADVHGKAMADELVPTLESFLARGAAAAGMDEETFDWVREGGIVMLGTVARHIDAEDQKVKEIVEVLVEALKTPSEPVQRSCGQCLAPLISRLASVDPTYSSELVDRLLEMAVSSEGYADRRGAAFGLGGLVRGLRLMSLKKMLIMDRLMERFESKKDVLGKEGALYAFGAFTESLGKLFEPYVIRVLPVLLICFGDGNRGVQEAAGVAARAIMSQLTAHGVKLVLPHLLRSLEEPAWRTKQGAVQLLAAMAFCAPKQLGSALPQIVPKLGEVLNDPHPKVQDAAKQALKEVGETIQSPEIKDMATIILEAISNTSVEPRKALDSVLGTTFINTIDAASLALLVPILERGMRSQVGDVKRKACRILGSLCSILTDPDDMLPYLPRLLALLKSCVVDAGPEVRATAAKSLGSLVQGLGEGAFEGLLPWLLERLRSENNAVERQGAAQGLAHVLSVLGPARLEAAMPSFVAETKSKSQYVREGHMTLLRYLPMAIGQAFAPHLSQSLSCILSGLADETEGVRDSALRAGKTLVDLFAATSMPLLLPSMEEAMFSGDYRIRQSSIELLGTLLFSALGVANRLDSSEIADEETAPTMSVHAIGEQLRAQLGNDRYRSVLARLFIARSDVALSVRSAALHVWKALVENTPRAMNEILPTLLDVAISSLSHPSAERREMCGRAIGELVRKLGEKVITKAVPILKEGARDSDPTRREGACLGLREVMESMTRHQLTEHLSDLLPSIQDALTDDIESVREAAGGALSSIFKGGAAGVVESVVPSLMMGLEGSEDKRQKSLEGLSVILSVRPSALGAIVPRLTQEPLTKARVEALADLMQQSGGAADAHVPRVLPMLFAEASRVPADEIAQACQQAANALVVMRDEEDVVAEIVDVLARNMEGDATRLSSVRCVGYFSKHVKGDVRERAEVLIPPLVLSMADADEGIVAAAWEAVGNLTGAIAKEVYPSLVRCVKDAVDASAGAARARGEGTIAGLCLPKGMAPLVPIYIQGLLQGSSTELRELAAEGVGDLVSATTAEALKPFVLQITGPLIRILGDRFPAEVKAAILRTLGLVISKAGAALKPFVPQLQTSFLKCLHDQAVQVRLVAAANLGDLSSMSMRVDQLAVDLATTAQGHDPATADGFLKALRGLLVTSGDRLKGETLAAVGETLSAMATFVQEKQEPEALRAALAGALGALVGRCSEADAAEVLAQFVSGATDVVRERIHFQALVLAGAAKFAAAKTIQIVGATELARAVIRMARVDSEARECLGAVIAWIGVEELSSSDNKDFTLGVLPAFAVLLGPDMYGTVQVNALRAMRRMDEAKEGCLLDSLTHVVPALATSIEKLSGLQKIYAERTLGQILGVANGTSEVDAYLESGEASASIKKLLNSVYLQRLMRLVEKMEEDDEFDDMGL